MRDFINNNQAIVAVVVVVVLALTLFLLLRGGSDSASTSEVFYYDLTTGDLVAVEPTGESPLELPNGNQGVEAFVFACNDCEDESDRVVAYVQRMTARAAAMSDEEFASLAMGMGSGIYEVSTPELISEGDRWYDPQSRGGMEILERVSRMCQSGRPKACGP